MRAAQLELSKASPCSSIAVRTPTLNLRGATACDLAATRGHGAIVALLAESCRVLAAEKRRQEATE